MLTFLDSSHPLATASRAQLLQGRRPGLAGLTLADILRPSALAGPSGAKATAQVGYHDLPVRWAVAHRHVRPQTPTRPARAPRRVQADPDQRARPGCLRADAATCQDRRPFSVLRDLRTVDTHSAEELMRGSWGVMAPVKRMPVFGSVVSRLRGSAGERGMPTYVSLDAGDPGDPDFLGPGHKPFKPSSFRTRKPEPAPVHRSVTPGGPQGRCGGSTTEPHAWTTAPATWLAWSSTPALELITSARHATPSTSARNRRAAASATTSATSTA